MTTLYNETQEGGIRFASSRRIGDVRIPNYVYDLWMPLLGSDAMGVYAVYCRLERAGVVKAMTMARIAHECRIGVAKLTKINDQLVDCGFVKIIKPTGHKRLMHWTTEITVLDPPQTVCCDLIDKYAHESGYETLCPWLVDTENPNGISGDAKQVVYEIPNGSSKVAALGLQPLEVAPSPAKPKAKETKTASDDCVIDFREYPFAEPGQTVIKDGIVVWRIDLGDTGERTCPKCGKEYTVTSLQASRAVCPGKACGMGIRAYLGDETTARWRPPQKLRPRRAPVIIPYRAAVATFCELANLDMGRLGDTTAAQWGYVLREVADEAGAGETETVEAIGRIESHTEGWPSNPFQRSFKGELAAQLARAPEPEAQEVIVPEWART